METLLVPLKRITVKTDRGRKQFTRIEELSISLRTKGFIHPILVTDDPDKEGHYILIAGARLISWDDSWDIHNHGGEAMGFEGVVLLHKSRLANLLGDKFAAKLWNAKLRRRVETKGTN